MSLRHGSMTLPTGVDITGVNIHRVQETKEDVSIESMDDAGAFSGEGKSLRKKVNYLISGDCLDDLSLPAEGSGAATSASPKIQRAQITDENEGAATFEVEAYYYSDGAGDYSAPA